MRINDKQYGIPETIYKDTKDNIESLSSPIEGMIALAIDTHKFGYYDGTVWKWQVLNKIDVVAPTGSNNLSEGYTAGSIWIDTYTDTAYICVDSNISNAVWKIISPTSLGELLNVVLTDPINGQVLKYDNGDWINATDAGGSLNVQEIDGTPSVDNVTTIKVTNGTLTDNGNGEIILDFGSAATDGAAIHDNVANEISAITEKATPVGADLALIEDSENGYIKKKVQLTNLPGGTGGAPTDAQYVTLAVDASLSAERVLTAGDGISLTDGGANGNLTIDADLDLIASWEHSTDVTSVDLTIPTSALTDFSSLKVVICVRTDRATNTLEGIRIRFSTGSTYDTGNNYSRRAVEEGDASATENNLSGDSIWVGRYSFSGATADANVYGLAELIIAGFGSSSIKTSVNGLSGVFASSANYRLSRFWGMWKNAGQVDGIRFYTDQGSNMVAGSFIKVYGLRK